MLTAFDKALLNIIQTNLPLDSRPFLVLANQLGTTESVVIERLRTLKENGYIRRIGPFFDSVKLGYAGTLVAVQVDADYVESVAEAINAYTGVTHNYEREGQFNLWFTLLTPDIETQREILSYIGNLPGVIKLLDLPASKKFKVSVQFTLE
ncbi:siroheme decarboxylase subunit alpha [Dendrosporobacter sp. 1207_IL3150]|uniref:siroheme decarboxylase subunit alpha n=1 Tax=Dendrosporobacter sp. 1207_IL3150 TaxID=3084054 RepID=UPI002FDB6458